MRRKIGSGFLALMMLFAFLGSCLLMAQPAMAAKDYSKVRVKLSNANDGSLNITFNGSYKIKSTGKAISGAVVITQVNNKLKIVQKNTNQVLYQGSNTIYITRQDDQAGKAGVFRMYNTQHGNRNYLGDVEITVSGEKSFQVINHVPMEHYLYGVVAHEMSNKFPLEALKAQSIAARGYVAGRIGSYTKYDLGDTPSDQVYRGYDASHTNVIAAVNATKGQILTYKDRVILPYYGSSNGGQTDLTSNAWTVALAYCPMKDDPYDLRNPNSMQQKIFFPETVSDSTPLDAKLESFLKLQVATKLAEQGYSDYADQMKIVGIRDFEAYDAKFPEPSRSFTKAKANVRVLAMKGSGTGETTSGAKQGTKPVKPVYTQIENNSSSGPLYQDQNGNIVDEETMNANLATYESDLAVWTSGNTTLKNSGQGMTGSTEEVTIPISFTIYDLKDKTKGYRLFTNDNLRMYWSEKVDGGANLVNVRFGHGVGMSQRGAQQMANEGLTYKDILEFYYDNCKIETYNYSIPSIGDVSPASNQEDTSVGVSSEEEAVTGVTKQQVSLYASTTATKPTAKLKANFTVNILAQQGDWVLVGTTGGVTGLAKASDIWVQDAQAVTTKATALYEQANTSSAPKATMNNKETVVITGRSGNYYAVTRADGSTGYTELSSLQLVIDNPQLALSSKTNSGQSKKEITAYTTTAKKTVAYTVPEGYVFTILSKTKTGLYNISFNGKKAYVISADVTVLKKGSQHPNVTQVIQSYFPVVSNALTALEHQDSIIERAQSDELAQQIEVLNQDDYYQDEATQEHSELQEAKKKHEISALENSIEEEIDVVMDTADLSMVSTGEQSVDAVDIDSEELVLVKASYAKEVGYIATLKGTTINLRKEPSASSTIIKQLAGGESVIVYSQVGNFYKAKDVRGNIGYISTDYVVIDTDKIGTIVADNVNIRAQASETSTVVQKLNKNDTVEILGSYNSFFKVETYEGNIGYVSDKYCKLMGVNIPKTAATSGGSSGNNTTSSGQTKAVASGVTNGDVNLRSAPSQTSTILGLVPKGTRINIFSKKNGFYRVNYKGTIGYVAISFVPSSTLQTPTSSYNTTSGSSTTTTTNNNSGSFKLKKLGVITGSSVSVRTLSGTKLATLAKDDVVEVLGSSGSKYKVLKGSVEGYVEDSYMIVVESKSGSIKENVNIRQTASTSSKSLGQASAGDKVQIITSNNGWIRIYRNGVVGYVMAKYVTIN